MFKERKRQREKTTAQRWCREEEKSSGEGQEKETIKRKQSVQTEIRGKKRGGNEEERRSKRELVLLGTSAPPEPSHHRPQLA